MLLRQAIEFSCTMLTHLVSVSRRAIICLGSRRISWQWLRMAAKHLEKTRRTTYHALFEDVDDYQQGKRVPMLPMALQHRDFEASDPRDKLYALLGLVAEQDNPPISADYRKAVDLVYKDFAVACLQSTMGLAVFSGVSPAGRSGLPTWVPDW